MMRNEVLRLIRAAFEDVTLGSGVTLREADMIDGFGTPEERTAARALDFHGPWWAVPREDLKEYTSVFAFMDAAGFRFYLPTYMTYGLSEDEDIGTYAWVAFEALSMAQRFDSLIHVLEAFTSEQCRAILAFVEFMDAGDPLGRLMGDCTRDEYLAVRSYWTKRVHDVTAPRGARE
ncbi:DUF6714 family protein [Deinococcus yavapaiensis]|uniref:Uncharacterized protein n=1 Tax=Deinococcus yavapaiensis KR-236 TaxID=694435 RepID=A0A318S7Z9_9DEIO|nr:DUF6714 family protein [Deinococcus yavapaiensis]PYE53156.1 hypothetical protein DES52_110140 [Deinococcus yavapaiensis KR-236]